MENKLLIDTENGLAGFEEWFEESDAEKIKELLNANGFDITIEEVDYEFKDYPILKKKDRFSSIPKTAKNVFTILSNLDKSDEEILKLLGIKRESGFIVTTMSRTLQGEYIKWQKIDHEKDWKNDEERLKSFANYFESTKKISTSGISSALKKMVKDGCKRYENKRFPECETEFNDECKSCIFGKPYIKTDADIERFNTVWKDTK